MTDALSTSSDKGDKSASVRSSLTLGWQIAELYHWPKNLSSSDGRLDSVLNDELRLPSRTDFSSLTQAQWLGEQIEAGVGKLLPVTDSVSKALAAVSAFWDSQSQQTVDRLRSEVASLHEQLLEAIYVFDPTLLKAYCLGQTLREISITRNAAHVATANGDKGSLDPQEVLSGLPSGEAQLWLSELKSLLPAHSAYAVSRTLDDWLRWAAESKPEAADRDAVAAKLRAQGHVWRQLLTDEKSATDFLKVGDYVTAGQQVFGRVINAAKRLWKLIVTALVLIGVVVATTFLIKGLSPNTRLITNLLWLAGVLGISVKGAGSLIGAALKDVEGWLWQAELDESVATRIFRQISSTNVSPAMTSAA